MARLRPAPAEKLAELEAELGAAQAVMGFVPNSFAIMAHRPDILRGFMALAGAILGPGGRLSPGLRQMVAHIASSAAGCIYCQAHTSEQAHRAGIDAGKIEALWQYETSDLFTAAERAALALAQAAASVPCQASDAHFETARLYYGDAELAELVAVISLFGFLNRWNATLATPLEESPLAFAEAHLASHGWSIGAHGPAAKEE